MSSPFVGEIRMFGGNFAPAGWMLCEGQTLPISDETEVLFNLIGTTYGGNGQNSFNLPDLRGRVPVHMGNGVGLSNYVIGQTGGVESVTLLSQNLPQHSHAPVATRSVASSAVPSNQTLLAATAASTVTAYGTDNPAVALNPATIGQTGGNQPHSNIQPYLCVNFIISLYGVYPSNS